MKDYRLTKDDLKPLAFQTQRNPHRPSAPCRLYSKQVPYQQVLATRVARSLWIKDVTPPMSVQAVLALADKKWGGLEGFLKAENQRLQKEAKRKANKRAKYEASDEYKAEQALIAAAPAREQALKAALAEHAIQLEHTA
ncbi:hypothetical protein ABBQ32_007195 [Trebouxia sp. C0010 RCD-2024]